MHAWPGCGRIAPVNLTAIFDRLIEIEGIHVDLLVVEQRGIGEQWEREDLRRRVDRQRLTVLIELLRALLTWDGDTDLRLH